MYSLKVHVNYTGHNAFRCEKNILLFSMYFNMNCILVKQALCELLTNKLFIFLFLNHSEDN